MNFAKEFKSEFSMPIAKCQMRYNTKKQPSTHCRAWGTINISKYVNNFLRTNPTTLILSSLVSEFDKKSKSEFFFFGGGGGGGVGGGGGSEPSFAPNFY